MCNDEFLHKEPNEVIGYLNELVEKAYARTRPSATNSTSQSKPIEIYHLRKEDNLEAQLETWVDK